MKITGMSTANAPYDYRELWRQFSEAVRPAAPADLPATMASFIAEAMRAGRVAIWLRTDGSEWFSLAASHGVRPDDLAKMPLKLDTARLAPDVVYEPGGKPALPARTGAAELEGIERLGVGRVAAIWDGERTLGLAGVGREGAPLSPQDEEFLMCVAHRMGSLIAERRLFDDRLRAAEQETLERALGSIRHELRNVAAVQSITLENADARRDDPAFVADAFRAFARTTEKIMALAARLGLRADGAVASEPRGSDR
ncbi:MAG TPA: hypothetical protein VNN77_09425 [candidate division Zixibacteria bacterium]|nr:hypothetical protein [candidate division Zixibacteria bacterium]